MSDSLSFPPGHWIFRDILDSSLVESLVSAYVDNLDLCSPSDSHSPLNGVSSQSNPYDLSRSESVLWRLITCPSLLASIKSVSGYDHIRPIHYGVLIKSPGAPPTAWHRDRDYLPVSSNVFTAWVPLTYISSLSSIHYAEKTSFVDPLLTRVDSSNPLSLVFEHYGDPIVSAGELKPGDIDIHDGHVWHFAPENTTNFHRVALGVAFVSDGTCIELSPMGFDSSVSLPIKLQTLSRYFPGLVDGSVISGPAHPVL